MKIKFLGANQQVTGSCSLLETESALVLVDCGLFQEREYLARNWNPFPVAPDTIDMLLLTHVHLDHCGLIPKFVREGFSGPILLTSPSEALLPIVLLDSARIHEEDASYKKKRHKREGR
ncbi:MAG: MBL fold metallo-hydrolase, partial [Candidatus Aminicenantaceae bacterium]